MAQIFPYPKFRALLADGAPAVAYKLASYLAGTSTPTPTYTSQDQSAQNPNPTILDSAGEAAIWLAPNIAYKLVLRTDADVDVFTVDQIQTQEGGFFTTLTVTGAVTIGGVVMTFPATAQTLVGRTTTDTLENKTLVKPVIDATAALGVAGKATLGYNSATNRAQLNNNNTLADPIITVESADTLKNKKIGDNLTHESVNTAQWVHGQISEEITLSTVGTTTDSAANLLPANSIIEAVVARVTQTITTATDWKLGDGTQAARFLAAQSGAQLTAGATAIGLAHADPTVASANLGPVQNAAAKIRVTTTGTPGAGKIRVTVFYRSFQAPAS